MRDEYHGTNAPMIVVCRLPDLAEFQWSARRSVGPTRGKPGPVAPPMGYIRLEAASGLGYLGGHCDQVLENQSRLNWSR